MRKKQLINEIMGVPKSLTPWVNSFYQIIMDAIEVETKDGWEYEGEVTYFNPNIDEEVTEQSFKTDMLTLPGNEVMEELMEINGYSDMKEFLNSEMFKGLPLWRPEIKFFVIGVPKEMYDIEKGNPISAAVGVDLNQKVTGIGKVDVFPKTKFEFEIIMPLDGDKSKFNADLKSTISHELLHAYQKVKQSEAGKPSHYGKETLLNALSQNPNLNQIELEQWRFFLHLVYLHLSFEINARVVELYHKFSEMGVNTKEEFLKEIKNTHIWKQIKMLENFNAEDFIKSFEIPTEGPNINSILGSNNPLEMLHILMGGQLEKMSLEKRGINLSSVDDALKSLINLWDTILQSGNEHLKQETGIDFNMMPVPENAKKDPYLFFKFFEKRFHKKAQKWKRKIYRLSSLLIQDNEKKTLQ